MTALDKAGDWMLRLQSDELDPRELAEWLDWYDADPENRDAFESLQGEYEALRAGPMERRSALAQRLIASSRHPGPYFLGTPLPRALLLSR